MPRQKAVFLQIFRFAFDINRGHPQGIRDLADRFRLFPNHICDVLRQGASEKIAVVAFASHRTVCPAQGKPDRIEAQLAGAPHRFHPPFQFFFGFK